MVAVRKWWDDLHDDAGTPPTVPGHLKGNDVTCTICGATLESTATTCSSCGATVRTAGGSASATPSTGGGSAAVPSTGGGTAAAQPTPEPAGATHGGTAGGQHHQPSGGPPPAGGYPAWSPPAPHPSGLSSEARGWALGAHLAALGFGLATMAVLAFLGPLLVWLLKRDDHPFVDHHAKEALNFQLTVLLVIAGAALLTIPAAILSVITLGLALIPIVLLALAAVVAWFALPIMAAVKASNGEGYRYPFTIRFVR